MKRAMQIKVRAILFGFCTAVLCGLPAYGDDTEIFFGATSAAEGTILPNVLFILDTSGSMGTTVSGTGKSRMTNMKEAFTSIMNSTQNINVGLMRFNDPGGPILYPATNIDNTLTSDIAINSRVAASSDDVEETGSSGVIDLTSTTLDMAYGAPSGSSTTYNTQISTGNNDAGETLSSGAISLISSTITMDSTKVNGFYFPSVSIPYNANTHIVSATLTFTARRDDSADISLRFYGQAADNAAVFSTTTKDISNRTKTSESVDWTPPAWVQDNTYTSPDLSAIIQKIVTRTGWASGHGLAILQTHISGGQRRVRSYNDSSSSAATLKIVYTTTTSAAEAIGLRFTNVGIPKGATIKSATIEFTASQAASGTTNLTIKGEAHDDAPTYASSAYSVTGRTKTGSSVSWAPSAWNTGDMVQTADISTLVKEIVDRSGWCGGNAMAFQLNGTDVATRIANSYDGDPNSAPTLHITYDAASVPTSGSCMVKDLLYRVSTSNSDATQTGTSVSITGTTLAMNSASTNGLRFNSIMINKNDTIMGATLEYTAKSPPSGGTNSGTASFIIKGEASDNAGVFTTGTNNISSRSTTGSVTWSPTNWSSATVYSSPELKDIVQNIVNRSGWAAGNALAFVQTASGTGTRYARTYDGNPADAVLLRIKVKDTGSTTSAAKTVRNELIDVVNAFVAGGYTPIVDTLYEGAQYYRGGPVLYGKNRGAASSSGRVSNKLSWTGGTLVRPTGCNDTNLNTSTCASENITGSPVYKSPIEVECQGNYIVLLTDGEANHNNSTTLIPALTGKTCTAQTNSGETCGNEIVSFLSDSNTDQSSTLPNKQHVSTYTISFNNDGGAGANTFLQNLAAKGNGNYYTASTAADLSGVFQSILRQILSANSTFVAPGATVNQFNRLTNRNEIYFSLFKPGGEPKWTGNLKRYGIDADNGIVVDNSTPPASAVDATTGFFKADAKSYWAIDNLVDGAEVGLGGVAGALVASGRKVYTNTTGTANVTLSDAANVLSESNTAVTKAMLDIGTWADADRIKLLQWARGVDVLDSNGNGNITETRLEMGDPLHSRPVIATYGGTSSAPDSTVFVGTNEGYLHAIDTDNGNEVFSFVPRELLSNLHLFYDNLSSPLHPYGLDGPITTWVKDVNGDNQISAASGDHVYLYVGMRRGGRNYYALDVTDRSNPKLMWTLYGGTGDFAEMGESWSSPVHAQLKIGGAKTDVLIISGGYDSSEDSKATRNVDSQGRAMYIVNATTGALVWSGGPGTSATKQFTAMTYAIPSDIRAIDITGDGLIDQMYVGDMGGQLWRFDINNTAADAAHLVAGGVIADVNAGTAAGNRRFYYAPDVSLTRNGAHTYLSIAIGSGWREHPLDTVVVDRFYVIKNFAVFSAPASYTKIDESTLFDATSNVIGEGSAAASSAALLDLEGKNGWYITLENSGEKVLAESTTINNQVLFTTYQPNVSSGSVCEPTLGIGRFYAVSVLDGRPTQNLDGSGTDTELTKSDRSKILARAGIPPSVISLFTEGAKGEIKPLTLVGPETEKINFGDLNYKTYWEETR